MNPQDNSTTSYNLPPGLEPVPKLLITKAIMLDEDASGDKDCTTGVGRWLYLLMIPASMGSGCLETILTKVPETKSGLSGRM